MANRRIISVPSKRNFSEKFFPARPLWLWDKARSLAQQQLEAVQKLGPANAQNKAYISWLKDESMLANANEQALKYSGKARLWHNPFAVPRPRAAVKLASVWYTSYPISMITGEGQSLLGAMGDEALWSAFADIGIRGIHTGPMKRAGGLRGWVATPSIDGHFDRISTRIDRVFGNEDEFRALCATASRFDGIVIDDIVPGHTGKGADFRLAEMNYGDYPGIYHMVEISPEDWGLLPEVPKGKDSVNINPDIEEQLKQKGYIIGRLQRVIFYEPGVKETNWSATAVVKGVDGIKRRWVYLHYFKDGQPSLNWLDPSFSGMKLVVGDALHSIGELGSRGLRLDANGFLGIEKSGDDKPAWSEGHPLSAAANQLISGMVRKTGGFTFQELNLSIDDIKAMSTDGADLSYDFINRPAYHHALATGDPEFLRLTLRLALQHGVDPASLVHALQNHDELTYELVHFWTAHKDDRYRFRGKTMRGLELRDIVRRELAEKLTGPQAPYNLLFTVNGIACTTVSAIAAGLGVTSPDEIDEPMIERIKQAHLLLAMFNAWQPGVFALSGWDLSGSFTLPSSVVGHLMEDGDTRWINRGGYDLTGDNPAADSSTAGMPKARSLYGALPEQLDDPDSFAFRLKHILAVRERYGIATSFQVDVPDVAAKGVLAMVHQLPDQEHWYQATVLNFSAKPTKALIKSDHFEPGAEIIDMMTDKHHGHVTKRHAFVVTLEPHQGLSLLVRRTK